MKPNINKKASQSLMMMMMMNMFANNAICKLPLIYIFVVVGENRKSQPSSGESRTLIILLITNDHPNDDFEN